MTSTTLSLAGAAGIALINSAGNLAGSISPFLVGWIKDTTGSSRGEHSFAEAAIAAIKKT